MFNIFILSVLVSFLEAGYLTTGNFLFCNKTDIVVLNAGLKLDNKLSDSFVFSGDYMVFYYKEFS